MNILNRIKLVHLICLFSMCCIVLGLWVPVLLFAAFAVNCVACLMLKSKELYCLLMFLMPFGLIYKYPGVSTSFLTLVEILVIAFVFLRSRKINMALFISLALITVYFAFRMNTYLMALPKLLVSYLLLAAFMKIYEEKDAEQYVDFFVVGLLFSSIVGIFKERIPQLLSYYDDLNYEYIEGEKTLRFSGLFDDPNYFAIALITAMIVMIFLKKYRGYSATKFYVFFAGLAALGIFTYSKSFILMFAAVLLLEVALNLRGQHRVRSAIEIGVILLAVFVALFGDVEIVQMIFSRFTNEQGLTTGRADIWDGYWETIGTRAHYFWVGLGLDAPYVRKAAHSLYIEMIYYSGIVGLVLFLFGWLHLLLSSHKNRIRIRNGVLIVAVFVMYAFLCGFLNYAMPFYMVFCWMLMDMDLGKKQDALSLA